MIKVFQLDECTWYAGENLEACVKKFQEETGCEAEKPHELTEQEMEDNRFAQDGICDFGNTFAEELEKMIERKELFPCFFACPE